MKFHREGAEILVSIHSFKTKGTFCVIGRYGQAPAQHPEKLETSSLSLTAGGTWEVAGAASGLPTDNNMPQCYGKIGRDCIPALKTRLICLKIRRNVKLQHRGRDNLHKHGIC